MMSLWKQFRKLISSFSFLLILSILIFTIIHTTENKSKRNQKSIRVQMDGDEAKFFIPERRLVHLDLKGAPPKISFFQDLFPLIRLSGGTDLLIEWEDMFPYRGVLANASSKVAYTVQEVKIILDLAEKSNLSVIPLVQTFGHLEHLLKIKEFSSLREDPLSPQTICPARTEGFEIIKEMVRQVLTLHDKATHIHIGCDEVYQLGQCSRCSAKGRKLVPTGPTSLGKKHIFLEHVQHVSSYIVKEYKIRPIIWDDMLRDVFKSDIESYGLGDLVDLMIWVYVEDIDQFIDTHLWETYSQAFPRIWAASAFKGAFGERMFLPNLNRHFNNQLSWLKVMERESGLAPSGKTIQFQGLLLAGWSRYDHFAVLCELLPVSVPSLVLDLVTVAKPVNLGAEIHSLLSCPGTVPLLTQRRLRQDPHQSELRNCKFPGTKLFGLVSSLQYYKSEAENLVRKLRLRGGWLTSYNLRHNFSSPSRLSPQTRQIQYLLKSLGEYTSNLNNELNQFFLEDTVNEWIEQNILPIRVILQSLNKDINLISARKDWPRRPVESSPVS